MKIKSKTVLHLMSLFFHFPVVKVPQKTLLMDALKEETEIIYDFCMCNPPFFANQLEAKVIVLPPQITYHVVLFEPLTFKLKSWDLSNAELMQHLFSD